MSFSPVNTLDAGIPTDMTDYPTTPDKPAKATINSCDVTRHMVTVLLVDRLNGKPKPDKIGAAIALTLAGFVPVDIVENIDAVMAEVELCQPEMQTLLHNGLPLATLHEYANAVVMTRRHAEQTRSLDPFRERRAAWADAEAAP